VRDSDESRETDRSPSHCDRTSEIGLELTQDGQWYKLYPDGAGGLERGHGLDHEGTYELLYEGDHIQMNMAISGGGFIYIVPSSRPIP